MSGLWTPDGERPAPTTSGDTTGPPPSTEAEPRREPTEEEAAMLAELMETERQLLEAPVEDVIANHCYGLFQLAALHLGQSPPHLEQSRLAIDALAALVEGLDDRLGQHAKTMRDGLASIRLAYVQLAGASNEANGATPTDVAPS